MTSSHRLWQSRWTARRPLIVFASTHFGRPVKKKNAEPSPGGGGAGGGVCLPQDLPPPPTSSIESSESGAKTKPEFVCLFVCLFLFFFLFFFFRLSIFLFVGFSSVPPFLLLVECEKKNNEKKRNDTNHGRFGYEPPKVGRSFWVRRLGWVGWGQVDLYKNGWVWLGWVKMG